MKVEQKQKKDFTYFLVVVVIFSVGWMVYSINQSPKWVAISKDEKWKVDYNRDVGSLKGEWVGMLYWMGESEVQLVKTELTEDGKMIRDVEDYEQSSLTRDNDAVSYMYSEGSILKDEKANVRLKIYWEDEQGKHEDTIELFPEKRYFVVPVLDLDRLENS